MACSSETPTPTSLPSAAETASAHGEVTPEFTLTRTETATLKLLNESQMIELQCIASGDGAEGTYNFIALASKTLASTFDPALSNITGMASATDVEAWTECGIDFNHAFGMSSEKLESLLADA